MRTVYLLEMIKAIFVEAVKCISYLCYRLFSYWYTHNFYMDTSVRVTCDPYFVNCMGLNREDSIYSSHFFDSIDISYENSSPV